MVKPLLLLALLAAPLLPADAQRRGDQDQAFQARREGAMMSLRSIENRIVPRMTARGAAYIGAELDGGARYRLKFMRDGAVIWVDVDGRTGAVLARAGE